MNTRRLLVSMESYTRSSHGLGGSVTDFGGDVLRGLVGRLSRLLLRTGLVERSGDVDPLPGVLIVDLNPGINAVT